jgi:predicted transcriptional regulator
MAIKNKGHRLLMIARLLEAVKNSPNVAKTRQFQTSGLNINQGMELSDFLVSKGYLRIAPIAYRFNYHVTPEGFLLLKQINLCFEAVSDKPKIGVMQFA